MPVRASATAGDPANNFLSPIGGEDQGEGARPVRRSRELNRPHKAFLKFIGPNNAAAGA